MAKLYYDASTDQPKKRSSSRFLIYRALFWLSLGINITLSLFLAFVGRNG